MSALVGALAGGGTGASTGLDGEKFNRQLHQKEIAFLKDKGNIEAFATYYKDYTGQEISIEDAEKILAQGGASLVDKSWNDKVGGNSDTQEARDFIKENYTDTSAIFYDDKNGMSVGTKAFDVDKDSDEYKDRYANIQGYTNNKDFYEQNLNLSTGKNGNAGDYANGAVQPLKDLGTALVDNPVETGKAIAEGIKDSILHPIDTLGQTGADARALEEKAQLDTLLGDDESAANHRGEAYGGAVANIVSRGVAGTVAITGIEAGVKGAIKSIDNAVDGIDTPNINSLDGSETSNAYKNLSDYEARDTYNDMVDSIDVDVEPTEINAKKISEQRAEHKKNAREFMQNENKSQQLDQDYPVQDFDYYKSKYEAQGYSGKELWAKIIGTSKTTNADVNAKYGKDKTSNTKSKPTKASVQTKLDKMPNGDKYSTRKNSDGTISVVQKDASDTTTHNIKVNQDGELYTPNAVEKPKGSELHHYATDKSGTHTPSLNNIAKEYDLDLNGDWNKDVLPHGGRHPDKYHEFVQKGMRKARDEAGSDKQKFLQLYDKYVKKPVRDNPDMMYNKGWE